MDFSSIDLKSLWETYGIEWGTNIVLALIIFIVGRWASKLISGIVQRLLKRGKMDDMLINFIMSILNAVLLLFIIIASLSQLGIDTTSLVALIGAAGLAIGLALKDSLQNFASGVMLILFKPFKVGNFVEAAGTSGVVESVGIFSSTFRTGDNREVIIPNGNIYKGTITNYSARETRRVDMVFGIGYDDDIKQAKQILTDLIESDERVLQDPAPTIAVSELADSSINFVVRPWVQSGDYWGLKWDMNEKVKHAFDEAGIGIPYPQMDVHLHSQETDSK
ncbi:mechanosensitive ion channel family protein [Hydrogenovibrio thermophilus]|uniref:Small-conductance mechanosensitive channel n=1 Tax=Hydrogenovibrio thermophilus TaxID=265883 RepID=A0A410H447_9GAMM|nr:mechanosensitive ion channel domain-containing protein [Hydrogenovibrio thermophilus]QAB15702.1 mechanosensitive ion channel [Hydrogenovibrio thermophilus]